MIVVDSSTWISYFNGRRTAEAGKLFDLLQKNESLLIVDLVLTEVLQGFRSDKEFELARRTMDAIKRLPLAKRAHVDAARLHRRLRSRGVQAGTIDCLIAQACIDAGASLLTEDTDFGAIAKNSKLKLATA